MTAPKTSVASTAEGDAAAYATERGCGPTEMVETIMACGENVGGKCKDGSQPEPGKPGRCKDGCVGRKITSVDKKKKLDISGDGSSKSTNVPLPSQADYVVYGRPGCPFCKKAKALIKKAGGNLIGYAFLIELTELKGRDNLDSNLFVVTLIKY